ncbi:MAG: hypothetical protein QM736_09840 [Vicinamibacterales bacterium]
MRSVAAVWLVVVGLLAPVPAWAKWTRVTSEHFTFVGDASERDIRLIAQELEQFRDVVSRVLSDGVTNSPVRTVVVVFQNDKSFEPFRPQFRGKTVSAAGYFLGHEDGNYIAVNAEQQTDAYGVIFHEFAHFMMASTVGHAPPG